MLDPFVFGAGAPPPPSEGPELILNGDGASVANWPGINGASTASSGGRIRVTTDGSGFASAQQLQFAQLTIGNDYHFKGQMFAGTAGKAGINMGNMAGAVYYLDTDGGDIDVVLTALQAAIEIYLWPRASDGTTGSAGQYAEFDNLSLKEVL